MDTVGSLMLLVGLHGLVGGGTTWLRESGWSSARDDGTLRNRL